MGFLDKLKALAGTFSTRQNKYVPPAAGTSAERALKEISPEEYDLYMSNELPHTKNPGLVPGRVGLPVEYGNRADMEKDLAAQREKDYELFLKNRELARQADIEDSIIRRHQPKTGY